MDNEYLIGIKEFSTMTTEDMFKCFEQIRQDVKTQQTRLINDDNYTALSICFNTPADLKNFFSRKYGFRLSFAGLYKEGGRYNIWTKVKDSIPYAYQLINATFKADTIKTSSAIHGKYKEFKLVKQYKNQSCLYETCNDCLWIIHTVRTIHDNFMLDK